MSGLKKKYFPSDELAELLGSSAKVTRPEVTKKVWAYIKKNDLQHETKRRLIVPDDILGAVIGNKTIDMFKMTAKISDHLFDE